jgi:hypothetical protein
MSRLKSVLSALPPMIVIGGLGAFVVYSLYMYKPSEHLTCAKSAVAQQTDIAVHVVRQWFGKEGQEYAGCQEPG